MEHFSTEEQQVEAIKSFWKQNGLAIVGGAVLGLGAMVGWRLYSDAELTSQESASEAYAQVMSDESLNIEKVGAFVEGNDSSYASLAALTAAKLAVDAEDFPEAIKQLSWVIEHAPSQEISDIASVRKARILFQQADYQAALTAINSIAPARLQAQVNELKGDIYLALSDIEQAKAAYETAIEADENNRYLQMKLDNLSTKV